jgi:hypothetical protein
VREDKNMDYIVKKRDGRYVVYMLSNYVASFETFEDARAFILREQEERKQVVERRELAHA